MFQREYECPSCGGHIRSKHPGARSLGCPYCGQTSHLTPEGLLRSIGSPHLLIDYGSALHIGRRFPYDGQSWEIVGRLRFRYDDGFWDEWVALGEQGTEAWIQEDDGSFAVLRGMEGNWQSETYERFQVGESYRLDGLAEPFFVSSKSRARLENGEGDLPFAITPGSRADFVDGIADGQLVSLEFHPEGPRLYAGPSIGLRQLLGAALTQ